MLKSKFWLSFFAIITFILVIIFNNSISYSQKNISEIRGIWLTNIDSDVLFSSQNTKEAINILDQLNFNTLYPTVWNWGYTLYPSKVAEREIGISMDPEPRLKGRDILQEIISNSKNKGMAVIPWFEFGFMAPADSLLAEKHPDWLTTRLDGTSIWLEGNVHKRVWLNPLHPEVQQFITDLVLEIVGKYEIEGIQFDDHFGYPSDFGYDPFTVKLYQEEHPGQLPPPNPKDKEWIQWRADKITDYMSQLFQSIKKTKPEVIVSVSPNPQVFSLESFLLDWETWERKGLIEELVPQIYRNNVNDFRKEIEKPEVINARDHIPVAIAILAGLKGRPVPFDLIKAQIETSRELGFAGVSFFFYESLWNLTDDSPQERQSKFKSIFSSPVDRPSIN